MPTAPLATPDLQEARHRNHRARHIVTGLTQGTPALAELWRQIDHSLSDVPVLVREVIRLRSELRALRLHRANLAAAARATLAARQDTERCPLWYLRDELAAQGFLAGHDATTVPRLLRCRGGRR